MMNRRYDRKFDRSFERNNIGEGRLTRRIEDQTAKIPSLGYLGFAVGSMAASAALAFIFRKRDWANFIGLWAPSILVMGLYNKTVKFQHELEEEMPIQRRGRRAA